MKELLVIGLGGFLGSTSRYYLQNLVTAKIPVMFPLGTLLVNLIGSFLIGLFFGYIEKNHWFSPEVRLFLTIGFCGSFTTFSTFAFENLEMLRAGNYFNFALYTGLSVGLAILLVWGGYLLANR
jgi:CrcB protein